MYSYNWWVMRLGNGEKPGFPTIAARLTETPPAGIREVAISRDARGNYYASFGYREQEEEQQSGVYHIGGFKGAKWYNEQLDKIRSKRAKCKKKTLPSTSTRAAKQFAFRMHFVSFQEGFERLSRVDTVSLPC